MKASEIKLSYIRKSTGIKITNSQEAAKVLKEYWDMDSIDYYECFVVMFLSRANEVLGIMKVSEGSLDACLVDIRKIYQGALLSNSSSIIICHNHPSGNLKPSQADIRVTNEVKQAGEFLKIKLLDHLILTSGGYYSFGDDGMI